MLVTLLSTAHAGQYEEQQQRMWLTTSDTSLAASRQASFVGKALARVLEQCVCSTTSSIYTYNESLQSVYVQDVQKVQSTNLKASSNVPGFPNFWKSSGPLSKRSSISRLSQKARLRSSKTQKFESNASFSPSDTASFRILCAYNPWRCLLCFSFCNDSIIRSLSTITTYKSGCRSLVIC